MRLRTLLFTLLLGLAAFAAAAAEPIVIRFSHVVAANTPKGKAAEYFRRLAEERTQGAVRVEVHPDGQLFKDSDEMAALQNGAVQMLAPSLSKFGALGLTAFELFDLPFIFPSKEVLYRVMDGAIGKSLFRMLPDKGITGLAYWDNGFKQMSANRALHRLADFKGLTMRVQASAVIEAQMRALGAEPRTIPISDVPEALRQGQVDGSEDPLSNFYGHKMHELQKHLTLSDHGYLGYAVIVNRAFWEALPADIRKTLEQAMKDATYYERSLAQRENDAALDAVRRAGSTEVYLLPYAERLRWWRTLLPVHTRFRDRIGANLIQATYKVAAQVARERRGARP